MQSTVIFPLNAVHGNGLVAASESHLKWVIILNNAKRNKYKQQLATEVFAIYFDPNSPSPLI